jgi:hypothetical protein
MSNSAREPAAALRSGRIGPLAAMLVGLCLLAVSYLWPSGPGAWTNAQQDALSTAGRRMQQLAHGDQRNATTGNRRQRDREIQNAAREYARLRNELDESLHAGRRTARLFFWSGIALSLGGAIVVRAGRTTGS